MRNKQLELYGLGLNINFAELEERIIAHQKKSVLNLMIKSREIDMQQLHEILGAMDTFGTVIVTTWDEVHLAGGRADYVINDMLMDVKAYGGGMIQTSYDDLLACAGLCDTTVTGRIKLEHAPWLDEVRRNPPGIDDQALADLLKARDEMIVPKVSRVETYPDRNRGRASKGDRHKNKRYRWS